MKDKAKTILPRGVSFLIRLLFPDYDFPYVIGIYEKEYRDRQHNLGRLSASFWLVFQLVRALPSFLRLKIGGEFMQIINFIRATQRHLSRHRVHSFINVTGLTIGFICFLFILLFVRYELNFDIFHQDGDRIYRVCTQFSGDASYWGSEETASTAAALAAALMSEFPEVESATKLKLAKHVLIKGNDKGFYEDALLADENFFKVFSFPFIAGDQSTALSNSESIVLSKKMTEKMFGSENPVGQMLDNLQVTGVIENVPENSHMSFDVVIPFAQLFPSEQRVERLNNWRDRSYYTYLKLKAGSVSSDLEGKLDFISQKYFSGKDYNEFQEMRFFLQSMEKIHLNSRLNNEFSPNSDIRYMYLFTAIAVLIMMIACLNYINLSTAQATKRAKEVGIRKVVGANRHMLFQQFVAESTLFAFIALILALGFVFVLFPQFRTLVERDVSLSTLTQWPFMVFIFFVTLITGLTAGVYPAVFLASFQPVKVLRGDEGNASRGLRLRSVLTVFQFSITIILLACVLVIYKQNRFIKNTDVGYNREHIVVLELDRMGIREDVTPLKNEFLRHANVLGVSISSHVPTGVTGADRISIQSEEGEQVSFRTNRTTGDHDFVDVFRMYILEGRNFSPEFGTDEEQAILVNEEFVKKAGWKNPVGKRISHWMARKGHVVGVLKDFNYRSLRQEIMPLVLIYQPQWVAFLSVRIRPGQVSAALAHIRQTFTRMYPDHPFEFRFLDDIYNQIYRAEYKLGRLLGLFALLAGFIGCLGLYGLVSFNLERRIKDIGIRKILGASVSGIVFLFFRESVRLILLACLLAWPIAYFVMNDWLHGFAYRIQVGWEIFIFSGFLALAVSLTTIGSRAIRAARANPVDALRYE